MDWMSASLTAGLLGQLKTIEISAKVPAHWKSKESLPNKGVAATPDTSTEMGFFSGQPELLPSNAAPSLDWRVDGRP